jgi:hypothetical protein
MAVGLFQELEESVSSETIPIRHCFNGMKTVWDPHKPWVGLLASPTNVFWKELTDDPWARWKPGLVSGAAPKSSWPDDEGLEACLLDS